MTQQITEEKLERFLIEQRSFVVWNMPCMVSDLLNEIRDQRLQQINVSEFMNKMVAKGVMIQIDISTGMGPSRAYLVGGHVTGVVDNANL